MLFYVKKLNKNKNTITLNSESSHCKIANCKKCGKSKTQSLPSDQPHSPGQVGQVSQSSSSNHQTFDDIYER